MERPEVFNHMFQIAVMGASSETKEWFEDFAMYQLFCNHTYAEAKRLTSNAIMIRDASVKHRCEQNQVYRLDKDTGEGRCVCHPGKACDTTNSQSTVGIVLASLILAVLVLLLMTTVWGVLRYTTVDRQHSL